MVGLLGGVGAGKSAVARELARLGACVVDADQEAHAVLQEPDAAARIRERFGVGILGPGGQIDRGLLGQRVFEEGAEEDRRYLEGVVHPRVLRRIEEVLEGRRPGMEGCRMVVLDVPLLLESPLGERCHRLVFVEAPREERARRAARTRGWGPGEVERREAAQADLSEKRRRAHLVVDNSGDPESLKREVARLFAILSAGSDG